MKFHKEGKVTRTEMIKTSDGQSINVHSEKSPSYDFELNEMHDFFKLAATIKNFSLDFLSRMFN